MLVDRRGRQPTGEERQLLDELPDRLAQDEPQLREEAHLGDRHLAAWPR